MTYEHDRALMEGARNSACDDYFSARPQIDTIDRRRVYEAGFQAGAASRDAEIAELKTVPMKYRRMAFNAQLQAEVAELAKERDQFRAELVKALAACKVKDEALRELDQLIPVGATIAALAIQPDDAALKAWLGAPVAWADAYGHVIRKSTKEFSRNSMTAAYSIALYSPNLPLGETK